MRAPLRKEALQGQCRGGAHGQRSTWFQAVPDKFVTTASEPARSIPVPAKTLRWQAKEGGSNVIEHFFPGWTDQVVASGGVRGDIAGDVNWIGHGVTLKSAPSDLVGLLAPRPVLEGHVRRRLMALSNVRV